MLEAEGKNDQARAARILQEVSSYAFHPSEQDRPFHAVLVLNEQHSRLFPEDLPNEMVAILALLAPEARDAGFSARLGDSGFD